MSDERIRWYRTKLERETLTALTRRSDVMGLLQALSQLALCTATGYGAYYAYHHLQLGWFILALFVHGTFVNFLGIGAACHELSHGTPFKTRWLNEFFYAGWLTDLCGGPQHMGMQSRVPDFRRCCRTVIQDRFTTYLYWQMNYHIEHHMYPAVPFFNLCKLHALVQSDGGPQPNRGLLDAWREIRMIQRKQRETPGVAFDSFSRGKEPVFVPQEAG